MSPPCPLSAPTYVTVNHVGGSHREDPLATTITPALDQFCIDKTEMTVSLLSFETIIKVI